MFNSKSWFDEAVQSIGQAAEEFAKTAQKTGGELATQMSQAISGNDQDTLDFSQVSEETRLAFYGALFAIASIDDSFDKEEVELIFSIMDLDGMSESAKSEVYSYVLDAPQLSQCLIQLSDTDERLRYGLMVNLIDTAWIDGEFDPEEQTAIRLAQKELRIADKQVKAIEEFVQEMHRIRERGIDDKYAADAIKTAASGLSAVGVPLAAVWFSGSVIGFSAAGITSGLAALGALVGFGGMIPGIGVAILAGAGIFMGVNYFLDTGDKRKKEQVKVERERKAQLVIQNLQNILNSVMSRIAELQAKSAESEANREVIQVLTKKMKTLQQLVNKRKRATQL